MRIKPKFDKTLKTLIPDFLDSLEISLSPAKNKENQTQQRSLS